MDQNWMIYIQIFLYILLHYVILNLRHILRNLFQNIKIKKILDYDENKNKLKIL